MHTDTMVKELVDSFNTWPRNAAEEGGKARGAGGAAAMGKELYPYDTMFSPIQINKTTVKNRIVMAPMGNIDMCEETGRPNEQMLQYFFARAKGGAGLLTTGLIPVSHGIDNARQSRDARRCGIKLTPAVVGDDDRIHAVVHGALGVFRV